MKAETAFNEFWIKNIISNAFNARQKRFISVPAIATYHNVWSCTGICTTPLGLACNFTLAKLTASPWDFHPSLVMLCELSVCTHIGISNPHFHLRYVSKFASGSSTHKHQSGLHLNTFDVMLILLSCRRSAHCSILSIV